MHDSSERVKVALRANVSGSDQNIATGHLVRCTRLGIYLQNHGYLVELWTNDDPLAEKLVGPSLTIKYVSSSYDLTPRNCELETYGALIVDLPDEPITAANDVSQLEKISNLGINLIKLGHTRFISEYFAAVVCLYPTKRALTANYYEGSDYLVLDPNLLELRRNSVSTSLQSDSVEEIFLCMGGADLDDQTSIALSAIKMAGYSGRVTVVVGAAYPHFDRLEKTVETLPFKVELHRNIREIGVLMLRANLGVTAFGTTAYELMGLGIPVVCITHKNWQVPSAQSFAEMGAVSYLGNATEIDNDVLSKGISRALGDPGMRRSLSETGASLIDFRGVERVAKIVEHSFRAKETIDVLYVLAHPGDETFSSAGTILSQTQAGKRVGLLILGDGYMARQAEGKKPTWERMVSREAFDALSASAEALGVSQLYAYKLPDNSFDTIPFLEIVRIVERVIRWHRPRAVYTNSPGDLNIDHQLTSRAVMTATRPEPGLSVKQVFFVETPSSSDWGENSLPDGRAFRPNWFNDIDEFLDRKLEALQLYPMELHEDPHPQSVEGVKQRAHQWGRFSGCRAAEAFQLVRAVNHPERKL